MSQRWYSLNELLLTLTTIEQLKPKLGHCLMHMCMSIIFAEPPELLIVPVNRSILDSGTTAYFVCVGLSEIMHTDIIWRYNGTHLTNDSDTLVGIYNTQVTHGGHMFTSSILELCGIDLDNAGTYTCTTGYSRKGDTSSFTLLIS